MNVFIAKIFAILLFGTMISVDSSISQQSSDIKVWYDVKRVYPTPTIQPDTLAEAVTIKDINRYYKPIWIREFISVDIFTVIGGESKVARGDSDILTKEQKHNMNIADPGTEINVIIHYMPENTLTFNEPKTFDFSFHVDADREACYVEGREALFSYLNENAISKIDNKLFEGKYNLAAVKFAIDGHGQIINAHVFETSEDEKIDEMLLNTVCNMPAWTPAKYANGMKVQQEFVLTVGNRESCTMNLLYVKK
jgi:hypothetical protein